MCGISGIISRDDSRKDIESFKHVLAHRGPDSSGVANHQVARFHASILHNRLSIIDLTDAANQPFYCKDGSAYLVYNGEIYNYIELRRELEGAGVAFRTSSDTEVLLEALLFWGIEEALTKLNGMWAFAFCDLRAQRFVFSRDRFGVKPFYYSADSESFCFGSEIKAVLSLSGRKFALNTETAYRYVSQHLLDVDPEETFFTGVAKLPPGTYGVLDLRAPKIDLVIHRFYSIKAQPADCTFEEAKEQLQTLLRDAVALRLRSDVKVGVLLSGGIDSSAITCLASQIVRERGDSDISLLSLTATGSPLDEGPYVRVVEEHLGRNAEKIDIEGDATRFLALLDEVQWFNDEPLVSFSAVAYYMMMSRARELGIKVLLTGQGADEVFCGYKKYLAFYLESLARAGKVSALAAETVRFAKNGGFYHDVTWSEMKRYLPMPEERSILGPALQRYRPIPLALGKMSLEERQILDIERTSIPALLHYEDRLSMAFSREVRVPFLDYRIVEFALSCPDKFRIGSGWTKYVLRAAIDDVAPSQIVWRKDKNGFAVPQSDWLKSALRPQLQELFASDCLMYDTGLLNRRVFLELYERFCRTKFDRVSFKKIFSALALEKWLRRYSAYVA